MQVCRERRDLGDGTRWIELKGRRVGAKREGRMAEGQKMYRCARSCFVSVVAIWWGDGRTTRGHTGPWADHGGPKTTASFQSAAEPARRAVARVCIALDFDSSRIVLFLHYTAGLRVWGFSIRRLSIRTCEGNQDRGKRQDYVPVGSLLAKPGPRHTLTDFFGVRL